ncbi:dUTP pyrophosphatase [Peptostreptococcus porci]|uniref:dUTP pyrophosphatase n=1 Tax=Peptostreptococcus porci TaxID=2652282 RepID=UPI002A7EE8BE|nr:dUTP pyrophosphatase [Peptostreptococcus porci]MDY4127677.1 dUTP pyrophosphatase [Peptostreptococcus porci]
MNNEIKLDEQGELMRDLISQAWDNSNLIKFASKEGVKIPTKRDEDAGYDVYAFFEEDFIEIFPHETKIIPTGLYSAFSDDYVAMLCERGSTGTKGIGQRCGIIDSGFRGEWGIPITNHNNKPLLISKFTKEELIKIYEKNSESNEGFSEDVYNTVIKKLNKYIIYPYSKAICQVLFLPIPKLKTEVISIKDLQDIPSERGNGKLGSSRK